MSILEKLRSGTDSTSTRLLIGAVMLLFILWIPGGRSRKAGKLGAGVYADVNGVAVTQAEFQRIYAVQLQRMPRNPDEATKQKMAGDLLDQMILSEAMKQEADRLGLGVSDEEVAREIKKEKGFAGEDGKFDQKKFEKVLKGIGQTPAAYAANVHDGLLLRKLQDLVMAGVSVSEPEIKAAWSKNATRVSLSFVRLPTPAFYPDVVVSDADKASFIQQNADKIKARYDEQFERQYNLPKRYELRTILLRTDIAGTEEGQVKARADAIRAEAAAGAEFSALATRWSEDLTASAGGKLGRVAVSQHEPDVAAAADKAGVGHVTDVVKTTRGYQIYAVDAVEDAKVVKLEEAQDEVALQLIREQKVGEVVSAYANKVVEAWKTGGAPPLDLLLQKSIDVETTGEFSIAEPEIPHLGAVPELQATLATATAGTVLPAPINVRGATTIVAVTGRTDPTDSDYAQQRDTVRVQLLAQKREAFADAWRKDLLARTKVTKSADFGGKTEDQAPAGS